MSSGTGKLWQVFVLTGASLRCKASADPVWPPALQQPCLYQAVLLAVATYTVFSTDTLFCTGLHGNVGLSLGLISASYLGLHVGKALPFQPLSPFSHLILLQDPCDGSAKSMSPSDPIDLSKSVLPRKQPIISV